MIQVQLLGAVEAKRDDGTAIELGHRKGKALLAALALEAGSPVPMSRLVHLLWGDRPPKTSQKTLQSYISRLRSAIGAELIYRSDASYVLDLRQDRVDVGRFQRRLASGDMSGALAEWSGPPLAGLGSVSFDGVIAALTEQWLGAIEVDLGNRIETDATGAIADLTGLTAEYPFREGLWALLMTALYHEGRQVEALAAFQRARRCLVEELGLEPGPRLLEVERMVLAHDAALPTNQISDQAVAEVGALAAAGNVVPPAASFVGRAQLVAEVDAALNKHRLVTLVGVGGVGKTIMARQVAALARTRFRDGAWLVELAHVGEGSMVSAQVAQVLGLVVAEDAGPASGIAGGLAGSERLLVLDNCEHVLDQAAALVEAILLHAPTVTILATSREPLRLPSERVTVVPSLDLRAGIDSPAVALFRERAQAASAGLEVRDEDVELVLEICRQLDGLPLAIELAAARTSSMTPGELLDHVDDRFRLLAGTRRGVARHQTLANVVRWSYQLLSQRERTILNRCSVFAGGFDIVAAISVAGLDQFDEVEMRAVLDSLVAKSLLGVRRNGDRTRFELLETIRQYGEKELVDAGAAELIGDHHAEHFSQMSDTMFDVWNGPNQVRAQQWLDVEFANLRTAHRWALHRDNMEIAATIAINTTVIGLLSQRREPILWAEQTLAAAERLGHSPPADLYLAAALCGMLDRQDEGLRYALQGLELSERAAVEGPMGLTGVWAAIAHMNAGDTEGFIDFARRDVERGLDETGFAGAAMLVGLAYLGRATLALVDHTVENAERGGNPTALAFALFGAGHSFRHTDPERARHAFSRCLEVSDRNEIRYFADASRNRLAALNHHDPLRALELFEPAMLGFHRSGDPGNTYAVLGNLALFFDRAGRTRAAARLVRPSTTPMTVAVQPELGELEGRLIRQLGANEFASIAAEGQAMDRGELIDHALAEIGELRRDLASPDRIC